MGKGLSTTTTTTISRITTAASMEPIPRHMESFAFMDRAAAAPLLLPGTPDFNKGDVRREADPRQTFSGLFTTA